MGWTKRDQDVEYVRGLHRVSCSEVERLARKVRAKDVELVPEVVAGHLRLSHMVGRQPDRDVIAWIFARYAKARPTVTWRTRCSKKFHHTNS